MFTRRRRSISVPSVVRSARRAGGQVTMFESLEARQVLSAGLDWAVALNTSAANASASVTDVAYDGSGNAYVTGNIYGTVDFDPGAGSTTLTTTNGRAFLARYNSDGALDWVKGFAEPAIGSTFNPTSLAVDASGNILLAGTFGGVIDINPDANTTANLTSNGYDSNAFYNAPDAFYAKFESNGAFTWGKSIGGSSDESVTAVRFDGSGNVLLVGTFQGTVDFDPGVGTSNLVGPSDFFSSDGFVARYSSSNGSWLSNWMLDGTEGVLPSAAAVDSSGNIYIVGGFTGTLDADPSGQSQNLVGSSQLGGFVIKLTSSGAYSTAFQVQASGAGSNLFTQFKGVDVDSAGNIYVSGQYAGSIDADPGAGTTTLTTASGNSPFAASYSSSGSLRWAKTPNVPASNAEGEGDGVIVVQHNDTVHLVVVGHFTGTIDFDPGAGTSNLSSGNGDYDSFAWLLEGDGSFGSAFRLVGEAGINGAAAGSDGESFALAGSFTGPTDFDPTSATVSKSATGTIAGFVAQYNFTGTSGGGGGGGGNTGTPDLTATVASVSLPESVVSGTAAKGKFNGTIANGGTGAVPSGKTVDLSVYARPVGSLTNAADVLVGTLSNFSVAGLASSASKNFSVAVTLPTSLPTDSYQFFASIDTSGDVAELNETNNDSAVSSFVLTSSAAFVDLTVAATSAKLPATSISGSGQKITLPFAIANGGNSALATDAAVQAKVYAQPVGADGDQGLVLLATLDNLSIAKLAAGKSKSFNAAVLLPVTLTGGSYQLRVDVDTAGVVNEAYENNNYAKTSVDKAIAVTQGFVDLSATVTVSPALTTFSSAKAKKVTVTITITNNGNIALAKNATVDAVFNLRLVSGPVDTLLGTSTDFSVGGLAAGKNRKLSKPFTLAAATPAGAYRIVGVIDPAGTGDSNSANDAGQTADFNITAPV